jgi:hypothetical protein
MRADIPVESVNEGRRSHVDMAVSVGRNHVWLSDWTTVERSLHLPD